MILGGCSSVCCGNWQIGLVKIVVLNALLHLTQNALHSELFYLLFDHDFDEDIFVRSALERVDLGVVHAKGAIFVNNHKKLVVLVLVQWLEPLNDLYSALLLARGFRMIKFVDLALGHQARIEHVNIAF